MREEFYWQLKDLAVKEKCMLVEVLEKTLISYQEKQSSLKEIKVLKQALENIEKQSQLFRGKMSWEELEAITNNLNPVLFKQTGLSNTYWVLKETLRMLLEVERERSR